MALNVLRATSRRRLRSALNASSGENMKVNVRLAEVTTKAMATEVDVNVASKSSSESGSEFQTRRRFDQLDNMLLYGATETISPVSLDSLAGVVSILKLNEDSSPLEVFLESKRRGQRSDHAFSVDGDSEEA